jgi:hypothetical protein
MSGDASWASSLCVGQDSKIELNAKAWTVPVTSKSTDPFLSCCFAYAAHLHSQPSVGEDLEVVIRFTAGALRAGSYSLGLSQAIGATLRSSTRPDGGAGAEAQVEGTLTVGGAPEDKQQAWQMGLCVSVNDSSDRLTEAGMMMP